MQRREAKNRPERPQGSPETEGVERYRAKIPTETAYRESAPGFAVSKDWMVETIWIELPAPHAGIEPVSETRVRNGIFCCRDRAAKRAHSARLQEQRPR
jgi:hypothetical protein